MPPEPADFSQQSREHSRSRPQGTWRSALTHADRQHTAQYQEVGDHRRSNRSGLFSPNEKTLIKRLGGGQERQRGQQPPARHDQVLNLSGRSQDAEEDVQQRCEPDHAKECAAQRAKS